MRLNPFRRSSKEDNDRDFDPGILTKNESLSYEAPKTLSGRREPVGSCPSGTMNIELLSSICPGFTPQTNTIQLLYDIPSGVQTDYHPHPGTSYSSTKRVAFLPNNPEGRRILCRFKFAWAHGLIFTIGKSLTSGLDNQVTWTTIPHKTSTGGGTFGFPDPRYAKQCNMALDKLGVPTAEECQHATTLPREPPMLTSFPPPRKETLRYEAPHSLSIDNETLMTIIKPLPYHPAPSAPPALLIDMDTKPAPYVQNESEYFPNSTISSGMQQSCPESLLQGDADSWVPLPPPVAPPSSSVLSSVPTPPIFATKQDEACAICFDSLSTQQSAQLKKCNHSFHQTCIQKCLVTEPKCPVCRTPLLPEGSVGKGPSGTMNIDFSTNDCPGFSAKAVSVLYEIPPGTQLEYHEHPGKSYNGTNRVAYLPNNDEGRRLLVRLKYAWMHGLTFRVGTSLTTGLLDQVTWTSIPHKTTLHGGTHGFPDPNYVTNCNASLDALHVPSADECLQIEQCTL